VETTEDRAVAVGPSVDPATWQTFELVVEHLGHPDAVLVPDETGDLKKGV
jgi:hypothetical protein